MPASLERHAYLRRRVMITRNWAGMMSSRSLTSSPTIWRSAPQAQVVLSGFLTFSIRGPLSAMMQASPAGQRDVWARPLGRFAGLAWIVALADQLRHPRHEPPPLLFRYPRTPVDTGRDGPSQTLHRRARLKSARNFSSQMIRPSIRSMMASRSKRA